MTHSLILKKFSLLVTRTCFEYGLAKGTLRRSLEMLQKVHLFTFQWVRLFYLHGPGQNLKSLFSQLDTAIGGGYPVFQMSGGEHLRDYLPVDEAARRIALVAGHPECNGIMNCCSGRLISIRRLVEEHIARRGAEIKMELGYYPHPEYEPLVFWGDGEKMNLYTLQWYKIQLSEILILLVKRQMIVEPNKKRLSRSPLARDCRIS